MCQNGAIIRYLDKPEAVVAVQPDPKKAIYFDYHATTPIDSRVLDAMMPFMKEHFGNPSSSQHQWGWKAEGACEAACTQVAKLTGCKSKEIVFTSGATESIYTAVLGIFEHYRNNPSEFEILSTRIEHKATLGVLEKLESWGASVKYIETDQFGMVTPEILQAAITPKTKMLTLLHGHNEIGTLNPIKELSEICSRNGIVFHVDAAQSFGKYLINAKEIGIDFLSISGHKIYGPKGIGALFINSEKDFKFTPFFVGGGQERGLRAGTHNVLGIVGLGKAAEIAFNDMESEKSRIKTMRDDLVNILLSEFEGIHLNGHPTQRLYHNINFSVAGTKPDKILLGLHKVGFSSSSACSSGSVGSHVLEALKVSPELSRSTIRIGIGRMTSEDEIKLLLEKFRSVFNVKKTVI